MTEINKSLLKRIRKMSDIDLLILGNLYKCQSRVFSGDKFNIDFNTLINELILRGLWVV